MYNKNKLDKRDIRRLELFCEIVEQGGINQAVATTGLSQPVLSNQLIELENTLNFTLCQRGRRGFKLTSEGEKVYRYAQQLNALLENFSFKLKGVQSGLSGHVRVGCLDNTVTLNTNPIPKAIEAFYELSSNVELTLEIGDFTQLNEKLSKNQLDMMIVVLGSAQKSAFKHIFPLFSEISYLYARKDLADKIIANNYSLEGCRINMGGYAKSDMYQLLNLDKYQKVSMFDGWNVESGMMLTLAGTHISFLPDHLIDNQNLEHKLIALNNENWQLTSQFYVVTNKARSSLSPAAKAFLEQVTAAIL